MLGKVMSSPVINYPSETQSAMTIQTLIASYLSHNGYIAAARGFATDVEDEEKAFGMAGCDLLDDPGPHERGGLRLEEGEEKDVSRRQRSSHM